MQTSADQVRNRYMLQYNRSRSSTSSLKVTNSNKSKSAQSFFIIVISRSIITALYCKSIKTVNLRVVHIHKLCRQQVIWTSVKL